MFSETQKPRQAVFETWTKWKRYGGQARSFNAWDVLSSDRLGVGSSLLGQLAHHAVDSLPQHIGVGTVEWTSESAGELFRKIVGHLEQIRNRTERPPEQEERIDDIETERDNPRWDYDSFPQGFADTLLREAILQTLLSVDTPPGELYWVLQRSFDYPENVRGCWNIIAAEFARVIKADFQLDW